jgi:putative membrane protein
MVAVMWIAGTIAALVHVLIFCMESLWWDRPAVRRRFRQSDTQAEVTRLFAFNQGFYNLFLAVGMVAGLILLRGDRAMGTALIVWNALSMLAAALVLLFSAPRMRMGALIQGGPALLCLVALLA